MLGTSRRILSVTAAAGEAGAEDMSKNTKDKKYEGDGNNGRAAVLERAPKLGRKAYEAELATLQGELVAMQEWVKSSGAKVCVVFEGRDTAGKGGTIKRIVERVSPGCSAWWRCPRRPRGRFRRCMSSATCRICPRPAR
jgi:polyphosphate kinase 2 (PPK2 family)